MPVTYVPIIHVLEIRCTLPNVRISTFPRMKFFSRPYCLFNFDTMASFPCVVFTRVFLRSMVKNEK